MNDYTNTGKYQLKEAKFFKCDLHCHTCLDARWKGKKISKNYTKEDFAKDFIVFCRKQKLDAIAITDHNFVDKPEDSVLESLYAEAKNLEQDGYKLTIFPGFELTTYEGKTGIQLHCILSPHLSTSTTSEVLASVCNLEANNRFEDGNPKAVDIKIASILEAIAEKGGVSYIPLEGHKSLDKEARGKVLSKYWSNPLLHAVSATRQPSQLDEEKQKWLNNESKVKRNPCMACFVSSDGRRIDGVDDKQDKNIGDKYTFIKMEEPSVEGLRQAFLDRDSRVEFEESKISFNHMWIKKIKVKNTTFLKDIEVDLSRQANCLIGGRGTGKSTLIEYVRFALGRDQKEDFSHQEIQSKYQNLILGTEGKQGTLHGGSLVELECYKENSDQPYIVQRSLASAPGLFIKQGDSLQPLHADVRTFFPVRVLSQQQIHHIALREDYRISIIDEFLEDELQTLLDEERELARKIREINTKLSEYSSSARLISEKRARLETVKVQIKALKKINWEDIAEKRRLYEAEKRAWQEVLRVYDEIESKLSDIEVQVPESDHYLQDEMPNKNDLGKVFGDLKTFVSSQIKIIGRVKENIQNERGKVKKTYEEWEKKYLEVKTKFDQVKENLIEQGVDVEKYLSLEKEKIAAEKELSDLEKEEKEIDSLEKQKQELLADLVKNWRVQTDKRQNKCDQIVSGGGGTFLILNVTGFGYEEELKRKLSALLTGSYAGDEHLGKLSDFLLSKDDDKYKIHLFTQAVRKDRVKSRLDRGMEQLECAETSEQLKGSKLSDTIIKNFISVLDDDKLSDLELYRTPDVLEIKIKTNPKDTKGKSIEDASDGEKSTAILALILSQGKTPLLIDQPEDDLDNSYVFDSIVPMIKHIKQSRQLVISTHNANIPVNGDAEKIIALQKKETENEGMIRCEGSIDNDKVKDAIVDIMEGGLTAFELRGMKYRRNKE